MALGFYHDDVNGHRVIGHGGDTVYMHTNLDLFIDDGVGLFISMNSDGKAGSPRFAARRPAQALRRPLLPGARSKARRSTRRPPSEHAQMLAGTYAASRGFETNFLHLLDLVGQEKVGPRRERRHRRRERRQRGRPAAQVDRGRAVRVARPRQRDASSPPRSSTARSPAWSFDTVSAVHDVSTACRGTRTARGCCRRCCSRSAIVAVSALAWPVGRDRAAPLQGGGPLRRPAAARPAHLPRLAVAGAAGARRVGHLGHRSASAACRCWPARSIRC